MENVVSLNGSHSSFIDGTQVTIKGLDGNYVVKASVPLMVTADSFTPMYFLYSAQDRSKGILAPQYLLTKAENKPITGDNDFFETLSSLGRSSGAYSVGSLVKFNNLSTIYKISTSYFMLNSDNVLIIVYELLNVTDDSKIYCPHSFLSLVLDSNFVPNNQLPPPDGGGGFHAA